MFVDDTLLFQQPSDFPIVKSVKVETPFGSLESDSGNHLIDISTVIIIIGLLYLGKQLINKYV